MFYETEEDRQRQREIAADLSPRLAVDWVHETPKGCVIDFVGVRRRDQRTIALECKDRSKYRSTDFRELIVDVRKVDGGIALAARSNASWLLGVRWSDRLGHVFLATAPFRKAPRGRTDRADPNDIDLCYLIPIELFS